MVAGHCYVGSIFNDVKIDSLAGYLCRPQGGLNKCQINIIIFPCVEDGVCAGELGSFG